MNSKEVEVACNERSATSFHGRLLFCLPSPTSPSWKSLCIDELLTPNRANAMPQALSELLSEHSYHRSVPFIGLKCFRGLDRAHRKGLDFSPHLQVRCVLLTLRVMRASHCGLTSSPFLALMCLLRDVSRMRSLKSELAHPEQHREEALL